MVKNLEHLPNYQIPECLTSQLVVLHQSLRVPKLRLPALCLQANDSGYFGASFCAEQTMRVCT